MFYQRDQAAPGESAGPHRCRNVARVVNFCWHFVVGVLEFWQSFCHFFVTKFGDAGNFI